VGQLAALWNTQNRYWFRIKLETFSKLTKANDNVPTRMEADWRFGDWDVRWPVGNISAIALFSVQKRLNWGSKAAATVPHCKRD
jgi:hypothetical protein